MSKSDAASEFSLVSLCANNGMVCLQMVMCLEVWHGVLLECLMHSRASNMARASALKMEL